MKPWSPSRTARTWYRMGLSWLVLAGTAWAGTLADADQLYRAGKYEQAADALTRLTMEEPNDPALYDRLAAARYRGGDFEGAGRAWDIAARLRGGDVDALFNSGNANYRAGRLEEALERYDQVLQEAPDHPGASHNKELLTQEIERRRTPQPPPPPQGGEGDNQQQNPNQDQQNPSGGGTGEQPQSDAPPQEGPQSDQPSDGQPSSGGQPGQAGEEQGSGVADLDEVQPQDGEGDPSRTQGEEDASGYDESQPITSGEAHRLLDGIEEGEHRVRISGQQGGKPW